MGWTLGAGGEYALWNNTSVRLEYLYDLGDKAAEYLRLPSLLAYLVFAQDEMKAWVWTRGPTNFPASADVLEGESAVVRIARLALDLPFAAVYERVRFK